MAAEKEPKSSEAEVPIQEALRFYERRCYYFFSGVIGITGCDPPVAFGPGVTPALLSVEPFELLVAVVSELVLAPSWARCRRRLRSRLRSLASLCNARAAERVPVPGSGKCREPLPDVDR